MKRIVMVSLVGLVFAVSVYAGSITHESQTLTFGSSIHNDYTVRYTYLQADFEKAGLTRIYYLLSPMKSCKTKPDSTIIECKKIKLVDVEAMVKKDNDYASLWKASATKPSTVGLYIDTYANDAVSVKEAWHNFLFDPPVAGFSPEISKIRWTFEIDGVTRYIEWDLSKNELSVVKLGQ